MYGIDGRLVWPGMSRPGQADTEANAVETGLLDTVDLVIFATI